MERRGERKRKVFAWGKSSGPFICQLVKGQKSALYFTCRNCRNTSTIVLAVRSVAGLGVYLSVFLESFLTFIGAQGRLDG